MPISDRLSILPEYKKKKKLLFVWVNSPKFIGVFFLISAEFIDHHLARLYSFLRIKNLTSNSFSKFIWVLRDKKLRRAPAVVRVCATAKYPLLWNFKLDFFLQVGFFSTLRKLANFFSPELYFYKKRKKKQRNFFDHKKPPIFKL